MKGQAQMGLPYVWMRLQQVERIHAVSSFKDLVNLSNPSPNYALKRLTFEWIA